MNTDKFIYIIDDNEEYSLYLKKILENNGYLCILFKDPTELFYELENKVIKPDLIIFDLSMPEINGLDIIKYLNSNKNLKKLKKIIVSAKTDLVNRSEFSEINFLTKPIEEEKFIRTIDNITLFKREYSNEPDNRYRNCQIFCFLENSSFYSKIVITKIFPMKVEFLSDIKYNFESVLKFYSRSIYDTIGVNCEFKIKVLQVKKNQDKFIYEGELIFENKIDYDKVNQFINSTNIGAV